MFIRGSFPLGPRMDTNEIGFIIRTAELLQTKNLLMHRLLIAFAVAWLAIPVQSLVAADDRSRADDENDIDVAPTDWPWWRGTLRGGLRQVWGRAPVRHNRLRPRGSVGPPAALPAAAWA